jgi:hypothetical protein
MHRLKISNKSGKLTKKSFPIASFYILSKISSQKSVMGQAYRVYLAGLKVVDTRLLYVKNLIYFHSPEDLISMIIPYNLFLDENSYNVSFYIWLNLCGGK